MACVSQRAVSRADEVWRSKQPHLLVCQGRGSNTPLQLQFLVILGEDSKPLLELAKSVSTQTPSSPLSIQNMNSWKENHSETTWRLKALYKCSLAGQTCSHPHPAVFQGRGWLQFVAELHPTSLAWPGWLCEWSPQCSPPLLAFKATWAVGQMVPT